MASTYIKTKVYPKAAKEVVFDTPKRIEVWVSEPAQANRANKRARALLARHLGISEGQLRLVSGHHSQNKTWEVLSLEA